MHALAHRINKEGQYIGCVMSVEQAGVPGFSENMANLRMANSLYAISERFLPEEERPQKPIHPTSLSEYLGNWSKSQTKPIILLIDEGAAHPKRNTPTSRQAHHGAGDVSYFSLIHPTQMQSIFMNQQLRFRVALAMLPLQMYLSWRLWWPDTSRTFPALPIWGAAIQLATPLSWCLSTLLCGLLVWWCFLPKKNTTIQAMAACLCLVFLCMLDLHRLQAWVWMWLLIFCAQLSAQQPLNRSLPLWVIAAVYVWSGLNKCTPWFASEVFVQFCEAFSFTRSLAKHQWLAYGLAAGECLIGIGLLFKPARRYALWGAVLLHGYILCVLSPLGLNWNAVVWPWNISLPLLAWHFSAQEPVQAEVGQSGGKWAAAYLLLALCWLAPAGRHQGWWPESLSWNLYANTQPEASVYLPESQPCAAYSDLWQRLATEDQYLLIDDWSIDNLGVPAFGGLYSWKAAARSLFDCRTAPDSNARLVVLRVRPWSRSEELPLEYFRLE